MRGQSLVELVLVIGLFALLLPALLTGFLASREGKAQQGQRMQAIALLKETETALKSARNNNWSSTSVNGTYYPVISGSSWTLQSGTQTINGLTQQVVISDTYRDTSGNIVTTGGTADPSTKKAVITISWSSPSASSITSTIYLTRTTNFTSQDTTLSHFNAGVASGAAVVATAGSPTDGQVELGTGGTGNWCSPDLTIAALDLPKNGVANSISAIEGRVFAGTGENASGVSYATVNIANTNPPTAVIERTYDGYKTNDVFGEANYAYLATDSNSKEIEIVNLTTNPYSEAGYFDAGGSDDANSVFVLGNTGYMTNGSRFRNFDLTSKSGSRPALDADGVSLPGREEKIQIVGNYAYVAIGSGSREIQIVDISNPSNLTLAGSLDVDPINSGESAYDVFVNESGTRAYLAVVATSGREFYVVNTTNKSSPTVVGSYEANGMSPKAVTVVTGNKAILVGTGAEEYQVIDTTNEASPVRCGGINIDNGVNGVASVVEQDGDAYSYLVTGDATSELKIIQGGSGGQFATSGTFESRVFDATNSAAFNRFVATIAQPSLTTLKMQVAVTAPISGSCPTTSSSYTYLGPNGNAATYFTTNVASISGTIPFGSYSPNYQNPQRCFRYKAWLDTTDSSQTPVLYDVKWNYSQ